MKRTNVLEILNVNFQRLRWNAHLVHFEINTLRRLGKKGATSPNALCVT